MKVEKEKRKVNIFCFDNSSIEGVIHINPGERVLDFINDSRESFIAVTEAKIDFSKKISSFKLSSKQEMDSFLLNKSAIKLIQEI
jgi:hypothetical protein